MGPFAERHFLEAVIAAGDPATEARLHESDTGFVFFQKHADRLSLAGHEDLVDYRSPRGGGAADLIVTELAALEDGHEFVFDSLPAEACNVFESALDRLGYRYETVPHTTTAVLTLPDSFDDYLAALSKKERHELRRKRRRYEASVGPLTFRRETEVGVMFEEFVLFHRQSPGEKGGFMTSEMEAYFKSLLELPGWGIDALVDTAGRVTAAGFGYFDETGYYLYNSTYDPAHADASPGVVLLGSLIELSIERRSPVFDFLKGDEHYKYRLGAEPRQLFKITGRR